MKRWMKIAIVALGLSLPAMAWAGNKLFFDACPIGCDDCPLKAKR